MIPTDYLSYARALESGGNDNARNSRSTSAGRYGFTDGTFLDVMRPSMQGKSDQEILAMKTDGGVQDQAMNAFTQRNAEFLQQNNIPITKENLYAAHHFGPAGAKNLLTADPNTPVSQLFGADVMQANPYLQKFANRDELMASWNSRGSGGVAPDPAQAGSMIPQTTGMGAPPKPEQTGVNWDKFGNSLISAGAALSSISSPAQAQALLKMLDERKVSDSEWQTTVNDTTGMIVRINKKTGEVQVGSNADIKRASDATAQRATDNAIKLYRGKEAAKPPNQKFIDTTMAAGQDAIAATEIGLRVERIKDGLDKGILKPDIFNRSKDMIASLLDLPVAERAKRLGVTEEQALLLSDLETLKNKSVLLAQLAQKGVQTEGDAIRLTQSMFAGLDMTDSLKLRGSLSNLSSELGNTFKRQSSTYKAYARSYADNPTINAPEIVASLTNGESVFERLSKRDEEYRKGIAERAKTQPSPSGDRAPMGSFFPWLNK